MLVRARALVDQTGSSPALASTVAESARIAAFDARPDDAVALSEEALRLAEEHGLDELRASVLNTLGVVRLMSGELREAISLMEGVVDMAAVRGDRAHPRSHQPLRRIRSRRVPGRGREVRRPRDRVGDEERRQDATPLAGVGTATHTALRRGRLGRGARPDGRAPPDNRRPRWPLPRARRPHGARQHPRRHGRGRRRVGGHRLRAPHARGPVGCADDGAEPTWSARTR